MAVRARARARRSALEIAQLAAGRELVDGRVHFKPRSAAG
jgi:hypothetical protein